MKIYGGRQGQKQKSQEQKNQDRISYEKKKNRFNFMKTKICIPKTKSL